MQHTWKILAPINLADHPQLAMENATRLAIAMDAELTLLYVTNDWQPAGHRRLEWPQNVPGSAPVPHGIHRRLVSGNTAEMIVRHSELGNADLILMTSKHCGGWKRFWKRSVTADVMASSRKPLWIVDRKTVEKGYPFQCRSILCLLKLDGTDGPVIRHAEALALRSGGELILASAVPESGEQLLHQAASGSHSPLSLKLAVKRMWAISTCLRVPHKTSLMTGSMKRCVTLAARQYGSEIVVASGAGPGDTYSGSLNIRSVLQQLRCPLVSVPHLSLGARRRGSIVGPQLVAANFASLRI